MARWEGGLLLIMKVASHHTLDLESSNTRPGPDPAQHSQKITGQRIEAVAPILNIVISCQGLVPCYNLFLSSPQVAEPSSSNRQRQ